MIPPPFFFVFNFILMESKHNAFVNLLGVFYIVIKTVKEIKERPLFKQYFQQPFKDGI